MRKLQSGKKLPTGRTKKEKNILKLSLTLMGRDSWSRPVYSADGKLYVDTHPRKDCQPNICTKYNNSFDGEPCDPVTAEFVFIPYRDTWD